MPPKSKARFHGVVGERPNQCEATAKSGARCRRSALNGSNVCIKHGSGTRLSREAARARLAALVPSAIGVLATALSSKKSDGLTRKLKLTAAKDVLDRSGMRAREEIVVHAAFDPSKFSEMSDEEIKTLVALARKASSLKDATDGPHDEPAP